MALQLQHQFGQRPSGTSSARGMRNMPGAEERPKAQFWLNVGYVADQPDSDGNHRFVALSQGIPLDQIEDLPTNSKNTEFAFFRQAQNQLKVDLLEAAKKLAPGEDMVLEAGPSGVTIQLRRVSDETAAPPVSENPFIRPRLSAVGKDESKDDGNGQS